MTQILVDECYSTFNSSSNSTMTVIYYTTNPGLLSVRFAATPVNAYQQVDNVGISMLGNNKYSFEVNNIIPSAYINIAINSNDEGWTSYYTIYAIDDPNYVSEYIPSYIPYIRDQEVWNKSTWNYYGQARSCVACALSTMKDIHEYKEGKGNQIQYSVGWIYGNRESDDLQSEGMITSEALDKLMLDGVPQYLNLSENIYYKFSDNYFYTITNPNGITAKQLVENNYNNTIALARGQRIASYSTYSNWEVSTIKNRIIQDGCVLLEFILYKNPLNYNNTTGIFTEYATGTYSDGHLITIIGWKKINSINYWVCANSWGNWNGDNGLYYIPFFISYPRQYYFVTDGNYPSSVPTVPSSAPTATRLEGGLNISWGFSTGQDGYKLKVRRGYDSNTNIYTIPGTTASLYSLQYGVTYFLSVCAYNSSGDSAYTSENQITTSPKTPTISGTTTGTSATINILSMSGNWTEVVVNRYANSGSFIDSKTITYSSGLTSTTWTGLSNRVTYKFQAYSRLYVYSTWINSINNSNIIYLTIQSRPALFYWDNSKVSGNTFDIKASEWNRLIQNIKDIHTYKLGSYNSSSYPMNNVSTGQQVYASRFNEVRYAIGSLNATGIATKLSGDIIYADDINTLSTKLNEIA